MGQCQSLPPAEAYHRDHIKGTANGRPAKDAFGRRFLPPKVVVTRGTDDASRKAPKLTIITVPGGVEATTDVQPPLTGKTEAETPMSTMPSPLNMSIESSDASQEEQTSSHAEEDEEHEEEELNHHSKGGGGLSLVHFFQSLRHTQELDHVIPEEVDPDAPSDEEDERLAQQQAIARKLPPSTTTSTKRKGTSSPPRPQDCIKMQHSRITRPNSVINRDIPTDQVVPGSVHSQTIAEFRKLKVQVKLAARQERKKARIAKLEDRYEDVRGYNTLWQSFEELRGRVDCANMPSSSKLKRSNSFDLHDTGSWFFDFQSFEEDASCYDFDDDASQSSLSLHSTASMESQRRYFKEKREGRRSMRRRNNSDTNLLFMNQIIQMKTRKPVDESTPSKTKYSPSHKTASTPPSILRGKKEEGAATPDVSVLGTPESRGPVAPNVNAFQIATGQPEYHVYKRPGEKKVDPDGDTPKATSRRKKTAYSETEEVDTNNDYQVTRRRRVASDAEMSLIKDERSVAESLGIHLPPSPEKREFDYSSFAIEVVTTDQPDVRVMRMSPKENEDSNRKEKIVSGNAAKCLEATFSGKNKRLLAHPGIDKKKRGEMDEYRYKDPPKPSIATMSTEDFLRFSSGHALVNVSHSHGHEILLEAPEASSPADDKENDASAYEDVATEVTEQIDVLLEKYRADNEEEVEVSEADMLVSHTEPTPIAKNTSTQ